MTIYGMLYDLINVVLQQKIVIKVQMVCDKCRTKALKIAAGADGN